MGFSVLSVSSFPDRFIIFSYEYIILVSFLLKIQGTSEIHIFYYNLLKLESFVVIACRSYQNSYFCRNIFLVSEEFGNCLKDRQVQYLY